MLYVPRKGFTAQTPSITTPKKKTPIGNNYNKLLDLTRGKIGNYSARCLTSEEWRNYSVLKITATNLKSTTSTANSNTDERLGATKHTEICEYCRLPGKYCSGHYAYIDLGCHIINPEDYFIKVVIMVFNCLCSKCGKPVIHESDAKEIRESDGNFITKLEKVVVKSKGTRCIQRGCDSYAPPKLDIKTANSIGDMIDETPLSDILLIFDKLSENDLAKLMYNGKPGPSALIMNVFPVIPPRNRLAMIKNERIAEQNAVTKLYDDIYEASLAVIASPNALNKTTMVANVIKKIEDLYGIYKKTITDKKQGINRDEQEGKPIMCGSRAVIVPAPHLPVTHCGVPIRLLNETTIRGYVNENNYNFMMSMMRNGKIKAIMFAGKNLEKPERVTPGRMYQLEVGDCVDRCPVEGDICIMDRPPTLHEAGIVPSIMHLSEDLPNKDLQNSKTYMEQLFKAPDSLVFGVTLQRTVAIAGDFDGDCSALVPPQSDSSAEEMRTNFNLERFVIDGESQKAEFAPVQDALLGCFEATRKSLPVDWNASGEYETLDLFEDIEVISKYCYITVERFLDYITMLDSPLVIRHTAYNDVVEWQEEVGFRGDLIDRMNAHNIPFLVDGVIPMNNLLSLILPKTMRYKSKEVVVEDGIVISSTGISNNTIGRVSMGFITHLAVYYTRKEAVNFITDCTWIFTSFISFRGYSIGMGDCLPASQELQSKIDTILIKLYGTLELDIEPEPSERDVGGTRRFWNSYSKATEICTASITKIASDSINISDNRLFTIIKSGAKGKPSQMWNMVVGANQSYEDGSEIKNSMTSKTRRSYYSAAGDRDPIYYGYCISSLATGLSVSESYSKLRSTRSDLIVMGLDTPMVGQLNRENSIVSMGMELGVKGQIRDSFGTISPLFSGDGLDPTRMIKTRHGIRPLSVTTLAANFQ